MKTGRFHLVTEMASCVARREMSILDHWRKAMRPARVSDEAAEGLGLASKAEGPEDASCAPDMACDDAGNQRLQAADAITALKAEGKIEAVPTPRKNGRSEYWYEVVFPTRTENMV